MDEFVQIRLDGSTVLKMLACLRDGDRIGADWAVKQCSLVPDKTGVRARFLDEVGEIIEGFPRDDEIDETSELHAYRVAYRNLLEDLEIAEADRIRAIQELEQARLHIDKLHWSRR